MLYIVHCEIVIIYITVRFAIVFLSDDLKTLLEGLKYKKS